ncbi:DUF4296 domain-containing protein [Algibacter sp. L3A6]|uniref:DUF4296 domain-containing protein n=1 Tax=Algibacter sp. L3A6 TaxID=2686366 RepID=UPI00131D316A|nr:DUF4296 domain-containing protein [Algibacter sp. L3A6]
MILNRFLTYLSIMLLVTACFQFKEPKKPKNLISKEKMVDILIDAKIVGSANMANKRVMESHGVDLETYVFEKHNIDSLQFAESNEYYTFNIKEYDEIYQKVKDSLEALKIFYQDLEEKEETEVARKRKQDSLQMLTTLKDSISNLKLHDSIKTRLQKEILLDTTLLKEKFNKIIEENKTVTDDVLEKIESVDREKFSKIQSKLVKPISDIDVQSRE